MPNLTPILFTGFGAAIIAAILFGVRELFDKYLTKSKKLPFSTVLLGQYISAIFFCLIFTLAQKQFTLNPLTIIYALIGAMVLSLGIYLHLKSITIEDFSLTLPFLSFTFVFLIPLEYVIFRQLPALPALVGIAAIMAGTFWLGYVESREKNIRWRLSKGSRLMLVVAFLYSLGGSFDKLGTLSASSLGYLFWSYTLIILIYLAVYGFSTKLNDLGKLFSGFKNNWLPFLAVGLIGTLGSWLLMNAYSVILVNYAIAIKRAGLIIPIILGAFLFKEKNLLRRLPGVLLMLGGAVIIILFG